MLVETIKKHSEIVNPENVNPKVENNHERQEMLNQKTGEVSEIINNLPDENTITVEAQEINHVDGINTFQSEAVKKPGLMGRLMKKIKGADWGKIIHGNRSVMSNMISGTGIAGAVAFGAPVVLASSGALGLTAGTYAAVNIGIGTYTAVGLGTAVGSAPWLASGAAIASLGMAKLGRLMQGKEKKNKQENNENKEKKDLINNLIANFEPILVNSGADATLTEQVLQNSQKRLNGMRKVDLDIIWNNGNPNPENLKGLLDFELKKISEEGQSVENKSEENNEEAINNDYLNEKTETNNELDNSTEPQLEQTANFLLSKQYSIKLMTNYLQKEFGATKEEITDLSGDIDSFIKSLKSEVISNPNILEQNIINVLLPIKKIELEVLRENNKDETNNNDSNEKTETKEDLVGSIKSKIAERLLQDCNATPQEIEFLTKDLSTKLPKLKKEIKNDPTKLNHFILNELLPKTKSNLEKLRLIKKLEIEKQDQIVESDIEKNTVDGSENKDLIEKEVKPETEGNVTENVTTLTQEEIAMSKSQHTQDKNSETTNKEKNKETTINPFKNLKNKFNDYFGIEE